jgi:hypothetical protein
MKSNRATILTPHNPKRMTPNKSLERTVNHQGRTVRAVALCAQAGANGLRWPAVQRNR